MNCRHLLIALGGAGGGCVASRASRAAEADALDRLSRWPLKDRAEALYVPAEPLVKTDRIRISTFALRAWLPTMFGFREYVE